MNRILFFCIVLAGLGSCVNDTARRHFFDSLHHADSLRIVDSVTAEKRACDPELCALLATNGEAFDYEKIKQRLAKEKQLNCFCEFDGEYTKLGARIPIIKEFYRKKTRHYRYEQTPLQYAVSCRDTQLVRLFLENGADANLADSATLTPMAIALQSRSDELLALLAKYHGTLKGVYINPRWLTPEELKKTVGYGADFNVPEISESLASIDPQTNQAVMRKTIALPLQQVSDYERLKIMLDAGARPNDTTSGGTTLLHYLISWGGEEELDLALLHHADIYAKDAQGKTALHYAVEDFTPVLTKKLLPLYDLKKANIRIEELIAIAEKQGSAETVSYLKSYTAAHK